MLSSDESIILLLSGDKFLDAILGNVDVIILGLDVGTEMGSLDGSFDGSNDDKIEGLLLGYSGGYTDGKVFGSYEGINMGLFDGEVLDTILGNIYVITLGIGV